MSRSKQSERLHTTAWYWKDGGCSALHLNLSWGRVTWPPAVFFLTYSSISCPSLSHLILCVGMRCQRCEDGYYGDPLGLSGAAQPCVRCNCNGNVDFNAVGICDHVTGRCLKCLGHTEGDHCERCQQGFYGNALDQTVGQKCKCE